MGWTNKNKIEVIGDGNVLITLQYEKRAGVYADSYSLDLGKTWLKTKEGETELQVKIPHVEGLIEIQTFASGYLQMPSLGIQAPIVTKNPINTPPVNVEVIIDNEKVQQVVETCEDLSNPHEGSGSHHGYYEHKTNSVIGTFFSKLGEVETKEGWKKCVLLGSDKKGKHLKGYTFNRNNMPEYASLRTKEGCEVFRDSRPVQVRKEFNTKISLPDTLNAGSYVASPENFRFVHASDIDNVMFKWTAHYRIGIAGKHNLSFKVNSKKYNAVYDEDRNITKINKDVISSDSFIVGKDYILEIRNHSTNETYAYIVRGTSLGGHFSTTYTYTCLVGKSVYVSSFLGDDTVQSILTNTETGEVYEGDVDSKAGQSFYIPKGLDSNKIFSFGFASIKNWCQVELLNYKN
jgi:hypothetical protein